MPHDDGPCDCCDDDAIEQLAAICCHEWMRQIGRRAWIMTKARLKKDGVKFQHPTTGELFTIEGNAWYVLPHQAKLHHARRLADEMVNSN